MPAACLASVRPSGVSRRFASRGYHKTQQLLYEGDTEPPLGRQGGLI